MVKEQLTTRLGDWVGVTAIQIIHAVVWRRWKSFIYGRWDTRWKQFSLSRRGHTVWYDVKVVCKCDWSRHMILDACRQDEAKWLVGCLSVLLPFFIHFQGSTLHDEIRMYNLNEWEAWQMLCTSISKSRPVIDDFCLERRIYVRRLLPRLERLSNHGVSAA